MGVDQRLTLTLNMVQVSELSEFDPKSLAGITYPGTSSAFGMGSNKPTISPGGRTKITYKIAKTVKETVHDDDKSKSRGL